MSVSAIQSSLLLQQAAQNDGFAIAFTGSCERALLFLEPFSSFTWDQSASLTENVSIFEIWRDQIINLSIPTAKNLPHIFGFVTYEFGYELEPSISPDFIFSSILPRQRFLAYRTVIEISRNSAVDYSSVLANTDTPWWTLSSNNQVTIVNELQKKLFRSWRSDFSGSGTYDSEPFTNKIADDFTNGVKEIKNEIIQGDVYQANLSLLTSSVTTDQPIQNFLKLLAVEPGRYATFLTSNHSDKRLSLISNSPELFYRREHDTIQVEPIKGTLPTTRGYLENEQMLQTLIESSKDRAELAMIVDLFRNDLAKICRTGSIQVKDFPKALSMNLIHHLYSVVTGTLQSNIGDQQILQALFPSGSITGAPKYTAMKTIARLERRNREIYCGSFITISSSTSTASVAIRTAIQRGNQLTMQAGCGITIDSDPEYELLEAMVKANAMRRLLTSY